MNSQIKKKNSISTKQNYFQFPKINNRIIKNNLSKKENK